MSLANVPPGWNDATMSDPTRTDDNAAADPRVFGDVATTLLFENDRVRVWEMRLAPGEESALHRHEHDYLMIQLAGDRIGARFEPDSRDAFGGASLPDRTIDAPVTPGLVVWGTKGGIETAFNPGAETFHEIVVELKDPGTGVGG